MNECSKLGARSSGAGGLEGVPKKRVLRQDWQDTLQSVSYAHLNGVINIYENSPSSLEVAS